MRLNISVITAGIIVGVAACGGYILAKRTPTRALADGIRGIIPLDDENESKKPKVIFFFDSQAYHMANVTRIDVIGGFPRERNSDTIILDVVSFVNKEIDRTGNDRIVLTSSHEEKIGDVVRVLDECRKSRAHAIVLNYNTGDFWKK